VGDGTVRLKDIAVAPSVHFSENLYAVREDVRTATITVTRNDDLRRTVTVNFATSDGTAKAGQDYGTTTGTLTFNPGEATRSFTIPIINDRRPERDQFLLVTLTLSLHKVRLPGDFRQLARPRGNATTPLGPPDWRTC